MNVNAAIIAAINTIATVIIVTVMIVPEFEETLPPLMPTRVILSNRSGIAIDCYNM